MDQRTVASHVENADRNRRIMLGKIRDNSPVTRKAVADLCGSSPSMMKRIVESLEAEKAVIEEEITEPSSRQGRRGRRARTLRLNPAFAHSIGISIDPGIVKLCAMDFEGSVIDKERVEVASFPRDEILRVAADRALALEERCRARGAGQLLGAGIGVAGVVNAAEGIVIYCPQLPGWEDTPLRASMESVLGCDVLIDDTSRCRALVEKRYGAGRCLDTFLYLYFGRGVGAGLILDNRIFRGRNGLSGEFGHITVRDQGPLCNCGNRGCIEAVASQDAILKATRQMIDSNVHSTLRAVVERGGTLTLADIDEAAKAGDKLSNIILNDVGTSMGTGIANLVNILDPGTVICGGEVVDQFASSLMSVVETTVRLRAMHAISQKTHIITSGTEGAASRGAATLLVERYLDNDILNL